MQRKQNVCMGNTVSLILIDQYFYLGVKQSKCPNLVGLYDVTSDGPV